MSNKWNRSKKIIIENFSIIAIVLFMVIILFSINTTVVSFSGKFPSDTKDTIETDKALNITDKDKELVANDKELIGTFLPLSYSIILDDLDCISKAAKNENFTDTERCARLLKENSKMIIGQIDSYNKSTSYTQALELYKKYLGYYKIAGENLEVGARNMNAEQMRNASVYIQKANYGMTSFMSSTGNNSGMLEIKNGTKMPITKG